MSRKIITALAIVGIFLMLAGCGHLDGNNPVGVTGGAANGYGGSGTGSGGSGGGGGETSLYGTWEGNYDTLGVLVTTVVTINSSGTYTVSAYYNGSLISTEYGTFTVTGNVLHLNPQGDSPYTATFILNGNTLTLTFEGGDTIVLHRR